MATRIASNYENAIVGVIKYADASGTVLLECDDPWDHVTVVLIIGNPDEAMIWVDRSVCVHDGKVYQIN